MALGPSGITTANITLAVADQPATTSSGVSTDPIITQPPSTQPVTNPVAPTPVPGIPVVQQPTITPVFIYPGNPSPPLLPVPGTDVSGTVDGTPGSPSLPAPGGTPTATGTASNTPPGTQASVTGSNWLPILGILAVAYYLAF